jgi:hypothetical protein
MYDWNVSVPTLNTLSGTPSIKDAFYNNMIIAEVGALPSSSTLIFRSISSTPYTYVGINLNSASSTIGTVLWTNTVTAPTNNATVLVGPADATAMGRLQHGDRQADMGSSRQSIIL